MSYKKISTITILLLAAGESSRLGEPKQLLNFDGKMLLQHFIDISINSLAESVILILGAYGQTIQNKLDAQKIHVVHNLNWKDGLSSSISVGLNCALELNPQTEAVVLVLCDQPYLTTAILNEIINKHINSDKPIVNCQYSYTNGPPTLFHKRMFSHLRDLESSHGAKSVVSKFIQEVASIEFPNGHIDIDTRTDYTNFIFNYVDS